MSKATSAKTSTATANGKVSSAPRLCHVIKVENFDGYGFNLHAEKGKPGQYIGKVDEGSPAELAGLRQGDRIIEVNAVNIGRETHKEVVQRIKAIANEVQLLVVDPTVPVTKDNRLVDPIPVNGSAAKTNGGTVQPADSTTSDSNTKPVGVLAAPEIVVQQPSTPSTPKDTSSHTSETHKNGHDEPDRSPIATKDTTSSINGISDDIIAIKINNESSVAHPITVAASKTSTFSTSPKDHSPRSSNSTFVSTATFSASEVKEEQSTVSTVTISASPIESVPELPKSAPPPLAVVPEPKIPSVTSSSASPPESPKPIVAPIAPTVPIVTTTNITKTPLTNGSTTATPSPPPPSSNGTTTTTTSSASSTGSGLNLNMTAAELRAKLAAKKKFDPKSGSVDLRKKFEIVEKL